MCEEIQFCEKKQNDTPNWPPKRYDFLVQGVKPGMEVTPGRGAQCISYDIKRKISCYLRQKLNLIHCIILYNVISTKTTTTLYTCYTTLI